MAQMSFSSTSGTSMNSSARIGEHHARNGGYRLFFHDTHHRAITAPEQMARV